MTHYTHLELHLGSGTLSRKHAKAIKACDGKATPCRGNASTRYVTLLADKRALIDELVRMHGSKKTTMVARGGDYREPAWVTVQYVTHVGELGACEQFDVLYASAREQAIKRGILLSDEEKAWDEAYVEATAENSRRDRAVYLEVMVAALTQYIDNADGDFPEHVAMAEKYLKRYQEGRAL